MTTPSHNDALEIAQQLVTDEYDTGITEESFLARAIALIEPKLRERDSLIELFIRQVSLVELWEEGDFIVIMNGQTNKTGFIVGRHEADLIRAARQSHKETET